MKYWIGPMSKNVVDSVIEFNGDFGFIPSRRQVDYQGGYVNDWTTGEFSTYVNGRVPIQRDHVSWDKVTKMMMDMNLIYMIRSILI